MLLAVLFGPLAAATVGAASMLGERELISRRNPIERRDSNGQRIRARFIGELSWAGGAGLGFVPTEFGGLIAATLVGAVVSEILEIAFALMTMAVRGGSIRDTARTITPLYL